MELLEVARICVEVTADAALPSRIFLHSYESKIEVDVEYSWKPSKCRLCLLFCHEEAKCKAVKSSSAASNPPRKIALPNCHPKSSSHSADLPFVVDCPGLAVKVFADSQKKAPASVSSPAAAVNMDAVGCGSSVGKQHDGVVREAEFLLAELGSEPGHSVPSGEGFPSVSLSGAKLRGPIGFDFLVDDGGQPPFVDVEEAYQPVNLSPLVSPVDRLLEGLGPVESRLQCSGGASNPSFTEIQAGLAASAGVHSSPDPIPSISLVSLLEEPDTIEGPMGDQALRDGGNWISDCESDAVSSQSSESWSAEDIANDPMHYVLQRLLLEKTTQFYVSSIVKAHCGFLFDFLDLCWNEVNEPTKDKFKSLIPLEEVISPGADFEALRLLMVAASSKPHIDSLSLDRKQIIFDFLCVLLKRNSDFSAGLYRDLDELVMGLQSFDGSCRLVLPAACGDGVYNPANLANEGVWFQAKSRRKCKAGRKNSMSSSGS